MGEWEMAVGDRTVMVREAGAPEGAPVLYFHGTPGSRLDVAFGDATAVECGVRVISFDRPSYGRSGAGPISLSGVARTAGRLADELDLDRFATLGWSGGGPFALAAAAVLGDRVTRVGVASGPAPFQETPGALDALGETDLAALALLPADPAGAAQAFCVGADTMLAFRDDEPTFMAGMAALLGDGDRDVLSDPLLRHHVYVMLSEAMRQGFGGVGWDNVAWVGAWDVDLAAVRCPVHLWYGGADQMMPAHHGAWLAGHLADARLTVFDGEGHLGPLRRWPEMLQVLAPPG